MIYRTFIALILASPAAAACPVADDMTTGIRLMVDDGATETYRALGQNLVELTAAFEDGSVDQYLLGQGVYILEIATLIDGTLVPDSLVNYVYPVEAAAMPVPKPGDVWRTRTVVDGTTDEKVTATWGAATPTTFGDCTYTVIPGEVVYTGAGYRDVESMHYLQELGFGYLAAFSDSEGGSIGEIRILSISKVDSTE